MSVRRVTIAVAAAVVAGVVLGGCGSTTGGAGGGAYGTPTGTATAGPPPDAVPAADGPVTGSGTVIEVPELGPQLCLGPVRESWPPQCEGVPLVGWDWASAGAHEEVPSGSGSSTRWGTFAVTGTFDGLTLTVTDVVPLATHGPQAEPSPRPVAPPDLDEAAWRAVEEEARALPGLLTSVLEGETTGPLHVEVVHDDGSLQAWADARFGVGAVRVTPMLR